MEGKKVCITGASGWIGSWVTKKFLEDGRYSVRGTVRNPEDEDKVQKLKEGLGEEAKHLELVAADLTKPETLMKAFEGVDYVIHVASPISMSEPKDEQEIIGPAVNGTENVINAWFENNVKRVVVTSSCLAIIDWEKDDEEVDESQFCEINNNTPTYDKSKILAEQKAWDMTKNPPEGKELELVVLCPALVMGKTLLNSEFSSAEIAINLMTGKFSKAPKINLPFVDVEDVARAHVLALDCPANERIALIEDTYSMLELGQAFHKEFSQYGYNSTNKEMGFWFAKILSFAVSDLKNFVRIWGKRRHVRNDKSKEILGLKEYKSLEQSLTEMGWSLIKHGMVEDKVEDKPAHFNEA